jgi:sulfhydrogenase subunit gamma (sulfur reductase)
MMAEAMCCTTKDLYLPQPATVVSKTRLTAAEMLFEIQLDSGKPLGHMPGQFVAVTVPGVGEAPISVSSSPDRPGPFQLMVRRAGRVTTAVHNCERGAKIGIRGPFGTHYPVDGAMKGRNVVFAAGGIGLAPLRSGIQYVLNHRQDYGKVTILYGTKSPAERLFIDELAAWSGRSDVQFMETVDRADADWKGHVGVITSLIPKALSGVTRPVVVACGPPIMYKFVIVSLYAVGVTDEDIYVSLERRMKCGIGKCGHCQINGLYACMDGAVFNYADIVRVQEAI